jgi:hypothetical protein
MGSDPRPPRRPLQILFEPPASPHDWRMTGRFNWHSPSYGAVPSCEWIDDFGARIWLPGRYVDLAVSVDALRASRCSVVIEKASQFLKNTRLRLRERLFLVSLCYMQLAADLGI